MHAMQSALAIKRERQKRASRCAGNSAPLPVLTREQLKPPEQTYSLTYFNVGVAFTLMGTFMVLTSFIPDDILGPNWTSMIPIGKNFLGGHCNELMENAATGTLFIILGVIMVTINQIRTRSEEKQLEEYVHQRLGKSASGAPLVKTPVPDCEIPLLPINGENNV